MTTKNVARLVKEISALSKEDADKLQSLLKVHRALSSGARFATGDEQQLYASLSSELRKQTRTKPPPYSIFKKSSQGKTFLKRAEEVDYYLDAIGLSSLSKMARISAYGLIAELAVLATRRWKDSSVPVWAKINSILGETPGLIDRAFPGYAESGMLSTILEFRRGKVDPKRRLTST